MTPALEAIKPSLIAGPCVYLIHLLQPMKHARHYVGSTGDLAERMRIYRGGLADCCAFMYAVHQRKIPWTLARTWSFQSMKQARDFEYQFKKGADGKQHKKPIASCPFCRIEYRRQARVRMREIRARRKVEEPSPCH